MAFSRCLNNKNRQASDGVLLLGGHQSKQTSGCHLPTRKGRVLREGPPREDKVQFWKLFYHIALSFWEKNNIPAPNILLKCHSSSPILGYFVHSETSSSDVQTTLGFKLAWAKHSGQSFVKQNWNFLTQKQATYIPSKRKPRELLLCSGDPEAPCSFRYLEVSLPWLASWSNTWTKPTQSNEVDCPSS